MTHLFHPGNPPTVALGAPRRIRRERPPLALIFGLVAVAAAVIDNLLGGSGVVWGRVTGSLSIVGPRPLLTTDALVQIAAAIFAGLFVLKQISTGSTPHLGYSSSFVKDSILSRDDDLKVWQVLLLSDGTGAAILNDMRYWLVSLGGAAVELGDSEAGRKHFHSLGLVEGEHFVLWKFSAGSAMSAGVTRPFFECRTKCRDRFAGLEVEIFYAGKMGDVWGKRVACVPAASAGGV